MAENGWIEQVVEKAVAEALEAHVPQLRNDLVRRVIEEVGPQLGASPEISPESTPAGLLKAISSIQTGTTQREILRALLDNAVRYCRRAGLFVIKSGAATGWQGRAFANYEDIKDFGLDISSGVAARAMQSRIAFAGKTAEVDAKFVAQFGTPSDDRVLFLPLLLKERVAALVYADAGNEAGGKMDAAALELLVVTASAWLEVAASRKHAGKEGSAEATAPTEAPRTAPAARAAAAHASAGTSSFSDPFAGHAPTHSAAAVAVEPPAESIPEVEVAPIVAAPAAEASAPAASEPSPEDADTHRKAQRFARLLVDEIKLYNQAKVTDGRKSADLYDRLKEDIDKSRATYQKRYGNTVAANADYFNHELVRSLAEDDSSLMGANFQR